MSEQLIDSPLLVIVGETASGKSALALQLAQQFGGEIICADSRTVYRGMDIGTAKPIAAERGRVPHFCLDLVAPGVQFTVSDFKRCAQMAIAGISARGKLPILVGGSGLYIDAILYDYQFRSPARPGQRAELELLSVPELQRRLRDAGIASPENSRNPRHLIRALETGGVSAGRSELRPNTLVLGVQVEREQLRLRIAKRVDAMVAAGLVDEASRLGQKYGWDCEVLRAPGYKELQNYLDNTKTIEEVKVEIIKNTMDLAKRQRTWFKRNKSIHWLSTEYKLAEAVDIATTFLNK